MIERAPDLLVCGHAAAAAVAVADPMPMLRRTRANWDARLTQFDALDARGDRRRFFDPFYG